MCWDPLRRENKLIALDGERLLDLAWTVELATGDDRPISYALSQTNGRSFEPPRSTGLIGQTATPLHLGGGNVLVAYRRVDEPGLWVAQARVTADGGWVTGRQIPLWAAEGGGTAAAQADSELDALQAKTSGLAFGRRAPDHPGRARPRLCSTDGCPGLPRELGGLPRLHARPPRACAHRERRD